jgi:hypothetical protein
VQPEAGLIASAVAGEGKPRSEKSAFDSIPDAAKARMAKQAPLVAAARRLRAGIEAGHSTGFTGISLAADGVSVYWKGKLPASVRTLIEAEKKVKVRVFVARYTYAELKKAERQTMAYIARTKGAVYGVRVPADGSGLVAQSSSAVSTIGVAGFRARALPGSGVDVRLEVKPAPAPTSRINDTPPFYGGSTITNPDGSWCSAGFGVVVGTQQFILTAGHCGWPNGTFMNGDRTRTIGTGAAENVGHDLLLVRASAGARIFDGGGLRFGENRTQFTKAVSGWADAFPNEWICQSGMISGANCNIHNTNNFSYSYRNNGNGEVYSDLVLAVSDSGIASRPGDSGGPVFTLDGARVTAKGTVSGGSTFYPFRLQYNGKCLDADANALNRNGTRIQLWTCNNTAQQSFAFRTDGSIVSATNTGYCLDADLNTIGGNGTRLQLWSCNGQPQQRWVFNSGGPGDIRSAYNGRCIDADLNTINRDGTYMQLWDCNGQNQQRWSTSTSMLYQDFRTANRDFGINVLTSS